MQENFAKTNKSCYNKGHGNLCM